MSRGDFFDGSEILWLVLRGRDAVRTGRVHVVAQ